MLKKISNIFKKKVTETPDEESLSSISKACSSLLIEVALSDKDFDEEEIKDLKKITTNITDSLSILLDKKLDLFSSTINNK